MKALDAYQIINRYIFIYGTVKNSMTLVKEYSILDLVKNYFFQMPIDSLKLIILQAILMRLKTL